MWRFRHWISLTEWSELGTTDIFIIFLPFTLECNDMRTSVYIYTEHQKKHHFFRMTLTKILSIKLNYIWTLISFIVLLMKHIWKIKGLLLSKNKKIVVKSRKVIFKQITKTAYWKPPWTFNSYSFNFKGGLCNRHVLAFVHAELCAREVISFCDFWRFLSSFFKAYLFKTKNPGKKHNIQLEERKKTILHSEHSKVNNFI